MDSQKYDYSFKIVLMGDSGVGKTSLCRRFLDGKFDENFISTIGVQYGQRILSLVDCTVRLQIWDTAGQQRLKMISKNYLRNPHAVVYCYQVNNRQSFEKIKQWHKSYLEDINDTKIRKVLVATKIDCHSYTVQGHQAKSFANSAGMDYFQVSSKTGYNVQRLFHGLAQSIHDNMDQEIQKLTRAPTRLPKRRDNTYCRCY